MRHDPADRCKVPPAFWRTIEHLGLPPAAVLRQARLPGTLHIGGQAQVTTAQYFSLWRALEDLSGDLALGIRLIEAADTAAYPPSVLIAFHARDYRDGLSRIARFKRLCSPEQLHFAQTDGSFEITTEWLHTTESEPAIATDVAFASFLELGRRGTGRHLTPLRVDFTRPDPKTGDHAAWLGCEIRWGAARNTLILKPDDLDRPFPGHNPELLEILTPALAAALGELQTRSSIGEQVKVVLKRSLASGRPELADVARDLGLSERTLQRRITEDGKTFRDLLVEARQELGRRLLADPTAEIEEVACLLGYQDTSSFYRAFRDWEGVTPNRWRELNAAALLRGDLDHALH